MNTEKQNEEIESKFFDNLISELSEYGIDTSNWEYDYGDCCYGGAAEFLSRCIKGYAELQQPKIEPIKDEELIEKFKNEIAYLLDNADQTVNATAETCAEIAKEYAAQSQQNNSEAIELLKDYINGTRFTNEDWEEFDSKVENFLTNK